MKLIFLVRYQQQGSAPPSQPQIKLDFSVPPPTSNIQPSINKEQQILNMQTSINTYRDQITQSEKNLNAQHEVFRIKKKILTEEIIRTCKVDHLNKLIFDSKIDVNGFEKVLNRIIQTCSKDNIIVSIFLFHLY
jgi:hypothetical protein